MDAALDVGFCSWLGPAVGQESVEILVGRSIDAAQDVGKVEFGVHVVGLRTGHLALAVARVLCQDSNALHPRPHSGPEAIRLVQF